MTARERVLDVGLGLALAGVTFLVTLVVLLALGSALVLEPLARSGWQP